MDALRVMISRKLKHPPIVEHVFEVRWNHPDGRQALYDEYELALGRLYERLQADFPHRERTSGHMPREVFVALPAQNLVFDRFVPKKSSGTQLHYPLAQYGPGVASYNVNKDTYDWEKVRAGALALFASLREVHPGLESHIASITLRAIDFFKTEDAASFLRKKLTIDVSSNLQGLEQLAKAVESPRFQSSFKIDEKQTRLLVGVAPGSMGDEDGILLDISAVSEGSALFSTGIEDLVDYQHKLTGDAFFELLTKELHNELVPIS